MGQLFTKASACDCAQNLTTNLTEDNILLVPNNNSTPASHGDSSQNDSRLSPMRSSDCVGGQYRKRRVLGRGRLAKVRLCETDSGEQFAMKVFRKRDLARMRRWDADAGAFRSALEEVSSEIAIMKQLRHPNVVRLHDVIDEPASEKLYLILEYVDGGALLADQRRGPREWAPLDEGRARELLRDVVSGLAYLHAHGVVHQDLKPDNVLLGAKDGRARIADFGVARLLAPQLQGGGVGTLEAREAMWRDELQREIASLKRLLTVLNEDGGEAGIAAANGEGEGNAVRPDSSVGAPAPSPAAITAGRSWAVAEARASVKRPPPRLMLESSEGTPAFRAPETYTGGEHDGRAADVWSLGVLLYVMLCGTLPFPMAADSGEEKADGDGDAKVDLARVASDSRDGGSLSSMSLQSVDVARLTISSETAAALVDASDPPPLGAHATGVGGGSCSSCAGCSSVASSALEADTQGMIRAEQEMEAAVRNQPLRFSQSNVARVSPTARALLCRMLAKPPEERATLQSIASDGWVTEEGLYPLRLAAAMEQPLTATTEDLHRALSARAPALDLAGSCTESPRSTFASVRSGQQPMLADTKRSVSASDAAAAGRNLLNFPVRPR